MLPTDLSHHLDLKGVSREEWEAFRKIMGTWQSKETTHAILVQGDAPEEHHGAWVLNEVAGNVPLSEKTRAEMRAGRARVVAVAASCGQHVTIANLPVRFATDEQWSYLHGLVVCDLAERLEL